MDKKSPNEIVEESKSKDKAEKAEKPVKKEPSKVEEKVHSKEKEDKKDVAKQEEKHG